MAITVAEIKAKLPLAEVYEINPDATLLIVADPNYVSTRQVIELAGQLKAYAIMCENPEDAIKLLEVKE